MCDIVHSIFSNHWPATEYQHRQEQRWSKIPSLVQEQNPRLGIQKAISDENPQDLFHVLPKDRHEGY